MPAARQASRLLPASLGTAVAAFALIAPLAALGLAAGEVGSAPGIALRLATAFVAVGLAPGLVVALLLVRGPMSLMTFTASAAALAFAVAQLLCFAALALHVPCRSLALGLLSLTSLLAGALLLGWRDPSSIRLFFPRRERWLLAAIILVALSFYPRGSPFMVSPDEDAWHLSVISRLAGSAAPDIMNVFLEPDLAFTHPAPGTHFFLALVANASGTEPLLVYVKARSYWAFLASLFLFVTAGHLFRARGAALTAAAGVLALVLNGTLAQTDYHWGQAAPVSHNTDIVMGVLMPGVVCQLLAWWREPVKKRRGLSLAAMLGLLLVVVFSHVREAPQAMLYVAAGALAAAFLGEQNRARRMLGLLGALAALIATYGVWHSGQVAQITAFVDAHRTVVAAQMRSLHGWDWLRAPLGVQAVNVVWYGWHGIFIVGLPLALWFAGRRLSALALALAFGGALLLIRLPALSLGASWATYDEIVMFPVRFFTPFSLLLPGALAWICAMAPKGVGRWVAFAALILGGWLAHSQAERIATASPDIFFGLAFLAALVGGACVLFRPEPRTRVAAPALAALALAGITLVTAQPVNSPFGWLTAEGNKPSPSNSVRRIAGALWSHDAILANLRSVGGVEPPPPGVVHWLRTQLPPDSVVLGNPNSYYPSTVFSPQLGYGSILLRNLTTHYTSAYSASMARHKGPPFFNTEETIEERLDLCRRLGVSAILLDPSLAATFAPILDANPTHFALHHHEGSWFIYVVVL